MRNFPVWTRQYKKSKIGSFIIPLISLSFLTYFGFHAFQGEYGLKASYRLQDQIKYLQKKLDEIRGRREKLERRVQLLQDGTLEKDMLDEQSRDALGVLRPDEVRIVIPPHTE